MGEDLKYGKNFVIKLPPVQNGGILIFPPKQYKENDANLKRVEFSNFKNKGCIPTEGNQQKCAQQFQSGLMNEWMNVKIEFGSF